MKFGSESEPRDEPIRYLAPFRSLEKIEDFYSVASILMPCSEVESGYSINFDATKENFP